jgi:NitT/TauT family transport system substrate-binding protein
MAVVACSFSGGPAQAQELLLRVGHFPNVTHVQALVARNLER